MRVLRIVLVAALVGAPVSAQTFGRDWSPADRTIIGDFTRITSVAAALDRVYVTSPTSLLIWHPQFRQWEGPILPPDPTMLERVFTSLIDPLDNSLWLARVDGWVHYDGAIQYWDHGKLPGGVQEIAFDLAAPISGLFMRSGADWYVVPRGGNLPMPSSPPSRPVRPATVQDAISANPALQANSAQILLDSRLAVARFTVAARAFDGLGWYLGTSGVGLLYVQDGSAFPERLTFGLPGSEVGALFSAPGGIWAAVDRTANSAGGLALVASDLSEFSWIQGTSGFGLPFSRVRRIVGVNDKLWAATDAGLARIDPQEGRIELLDEGRDLPDNRVFSLTVRRGVLAVGTARGLALVRDRKAERLAPEYVEPAYALALSADGDTVWVGTPRGLFAAVQGRPNLVLPPELNTAAALGEPVVALAWLRDTLVGLTEDRVIWRDPRRGSWWLGPTISSSLGRLRAFGLGSDGVWVAGEQGLGFVPFNAIPARILRYPTDLPGTPTEVVVDEDFLWVGTDQGLVRFRLEAVRP